MSCIACHNEQVDEMDEYKGSHVPVEFAPQTDRQRSCTTRSFLGTKQIDQPRKKLKTGRRNIF